MGKIIKRYGRYQNLQKSIYAFRPAKLIFIFLTGLIFSSFLYGNYSIVGPYLQSFDPSSEVIICWQRSVKDDSPYSELGKTKEQLENYPANVSKMVDNRYRYCSQIKGLSPNTVYYYKISPEETIYNFKTAPNKNGFTFAVMGDTRTGISAHKSVIYQMEQHKFSFYLNTGDMAEHNKLEEWDSFFNIEEPILKDHLFMPVAGNHDVGHGQNFPWDKKFYPQELSGQGEYYSFWLQNNLFIIASSEFDFTPGSAQYKFIVNQLETGSHADHIFMFYHRPGYSSGPHGLKPDEGMEKVKKYLVPLEIKYKVTVVFNGHDHCYERSYNHGVYYLTTGGGGAPPSFVKSQDNPYSQFYEPNDDLDHYHFILVHVSKNCVETNAITAGGDIMDTLKIGNCPSTKITRPVSNSTDKNSIGCENYPESDLLMLLFVSFMIMLFAKKIYGKNE